METTDSFLNWIFSLPYAQIVSSLAYAQAVERERDLQDFAKREKSFELFYSNSKKKQWKFYVIIIVGSVKDMDDIIIVGRNRSLGPVLPTINIYNKKSLAFAAFFVQNSWKTPNLFVNTLLMRKCYFSCIHCLPFRFNIPFILDFLLTFNLHSLTYMVRLNE